MSAAKRKYKPYPKYKDSGVEWLGRVPEHWELLSARRLFANVKEKAYLNDEQLTASQQHGVIPQKLYSELSSHRVVSALSGTSSFNHVAVNDYVISLRSFQGGIERCRYSGCITPAYTILRYIKGAFDERYFELLMKSATFIQKLQSSTDNLRDGKPISYEAFGIIPMPFIDKTEQTAIADFIERECGRMDKLVEKKQEFIALLKEKRQALITHAVTKGLDPKAAMKDSGVEWLGKVPKHWDVKRLRHVAPFSNSNVDKKSYEGQKAVRLCNYTDVYYNDFIYRGMEFMEATASDTEIEKFQLRKGQIIITKDSEDPTDIGIPALVIENIENVICGYHLTVISPSDYDLGRYLHRSIQSMHTRAHFYVESPGITRYGLNQDAIGDIPVALPPEGERKLIADHIDRETTRIDRLIAKTIESIDLLKERKTALITAAVTGQIDVSQSA